MQPTSLPPDRSTLAQAVQTVNQLYEAKDPPAGSTSNPSGAVIRALRLALGAVHGRVSRVLRPAQPRDIRPWTKEEDEALARDFKCAMPVSEMARRKSRTPSAVVARLYLLGHVDPERRVDAPN